ncbi:MAG: hypothetical protein HY217_06530 [Candidatus Rokubacteria bacterium]|nr:hypothetical protein [Candidatus Rokubacteria bacterium]
MIRRAAAGTAFALTLAACGGGAPLPPPAAPVRPAPAAAVDQGQEVAEKPLPPITYEAKGLRDPFEPLEVTAGAKGLTVSSTRLTGIVRSRRGVGYILRPGDTLGDGRLVEIDAESAVFTVVPRPGAPPNRVTLRLRTDS